MMARARVLDEGRYRSMLNFFRLALLDDSSAMEASIAATQKILRRIHKKDPARHEEEIVRCLWEVAQRFSRQARRGGASKRLPGAWTTRKPAALTAWRELCRVADRETAFTAALHIIGFRPGDIAAGLGVTEGTVDYRVGQALALLGGGADP